MDASLAQPVDDAGAKVGLQDIKGAEMAKRDTSPHAAGDRLRGDIVTGETRWIIARVGMEVEPDSSGLGHVKKPVDMSALILIHVRTPAQDGESHLQPFL